MKRLSALKRVLDDAGIKVTTSSNVSTAQVQLKKSGYVITINTQFSYAHHEAVTSILAHELAHVLRGDCLPENNRDIDTRQKHECMMIARDAAINTHEIVDPVETHIPEMTGKSVLYERILKQHPDFPKEFPGTRSLYELLLQECETEGEGDGDGDHQYALDKLDVSDTNADARRIHTKTVIKVKRAIEKVADDMPDAVVNASSGTITITNRLPRSKYTPETIAKIDQILEAIDGVDGTRQFVRTWMRPPRAKSRGVVMRGAQYKPRAKVVLLYDVSGSMTSYLPQMTALCDELANNYDPWVILHTSTVIYQGDHIPEEFESGGTMFADAYTAAHERSPDCIIHVTDGDAYDLDQVRWPSCPLVFVAPEMRSFPLQDKGHVITMKAK